MSSIFLLLLLVLSASAAQAEGTCSAVQGPPGQVGLTGKDGLPGRDGIAGRDSAAGRDGVPGIPGTCSCFDVEGAKKEIKKEIKRELKQSLTRTIHELFQTQKAENCFQELSCKNATSNSTDSNCSQNLGEMSNPATCCLEIYNCQPSSPSGQYWIQTGAGENAVQIYCNLETQLNGTRGWARVAYINMTEDGAQCPGSLQTVTNCKIKKTICSPAGSGRSCTSVSFAVLGKKYRKICGQAIGYQQGAVDAFYISGGIDSAHFDGISITYGSPRKHVWTYAAGISDDYNYPNYNCPCAKHPGPLPPSFIGEHYYCESGNTGNFDSTTFYSNDPLWDGDGCGAGNNCCSQPGMPWFCRTLPQDTDEDIEMRLCRTEGVSNEDIFLELLEIHIQ